MKVIEIFDSIDGEGLRSGQPCSFIRLAGCNLHCSYCDTLYSLFDSGVPCEYTEMNVDEIISKLNLRYKRVTLTGGEPLIHPNADILTNRLLSDGYEVNIETNGAVDICEFSKKLQTTDKLFYTIDYKLPSCGMTEKMLWNNFLSLRPCDVIKFVVGTDEDASLMVDIVKKLDSFYDVMPHIYVGTVYGEYSAEKLVDIILNTPVMKDAKFQVQLHKIVWDPEKRGV